MTATRAGAPFFFNAIRRGSVATDEHVTDAATGAPLKWEVVSGAAARAEGHPLADLETEWIKVHLARPVPAERRRRRVVIDKTYKDDKSYFRRGELIVFDRSLGIRRNAVVLPAGYRLVSCNVPSQVLSTPDGRVMITFQNPGPAAAPLVVTAASRSGPVHTGVADARSRRGVDRETVAGRAARRPRASGPRSHLPPPCPRRRTRGRSSATTRRGGSERRAATDTGETRPPPRHAAHAPGTVGGPRDPGVAA